MLEIVPTKPFKKDLKKYQHKKDIIKELYDVISTLAKEEPLAFKKGPQPGWKLRELQRMSCKK